MRLAPGLCLHPREAHEVLRRWSVPDPSDGTVPGRSFVMELVRCRLCGREWQRLESAQGEDV